MENDIQNIRQSTLNIKEAGLTGHSTSVVIQHNPNMEFIFIKAFLLSFFRSNTIKDDAFASNTGIILKNYLPDKELIGSYKRVCSFSEDKPDIIPISYLQTLFIGLLGKFITSSFFPVNPLGLIHIFQSFNWERPVKTDEILDLACTLESMKKTEKGIETAFKLKVISQCEPVWQGISIFLTKSGTRGRKNENKKRGDKKHEKILDKKESIYVLSDIGRQYAKVSGDYNPYHLYPCFAKLFGFKKNIAHGMWSLARAIASLEMEFDIYGATIVEASFKLPIFIPSTIALGYEVQNSAAGNKTIINFELRNEQNGLPHLKGKLYI